MNLDYISVTLRPRNAWQSMDLGFLLARRWFSKLFVLWCLISVPTYLLCKLMGIPGMFTLLIWWWLKPLYEAPLYFWCSRAMFQEPVTYRQALSRAYENILPLLGSYLFLYRPDAGRSQNMNVIMLEGLHGDQRAQRLKTIRGGLSRNIWLLMVCLHIELILCYAILILIYLSVPEEFTRDISLLALFESENFWINTLCDLSALFAAGLVAPFYVCAGFATYINRRMHLEAWDLEVQFQRLLTRQKIRKSQPTSLNRANLSVLVAMCLCLYLLAPGSAQLHASTTVPDPQTSQAVIEDILEHEDFGGTRTRRTLFSFNNDRDDTGSSDLSGFASFALMIERFLWILSAGLGLTLVYYFFRGLKDLPSFKRHLGFRKKSAPAATLFDLDITPDSLPPDIPTAARQLLNAGRHRAALSLLYRGSLSKLVHQHGVSINASDTETQCLQQVSQQQPQARSIYFTTLTRCWLQTAYGRQDVESNRILELCHQWASAFDRSQVES